MINLEEIVIVNIAGMLVLLLSLLSRIESKREKHLDDYFFDTMIGIAFVTLAAEIATFLLDGKPGALVYSLQYLINAYMFLASSATGTLWVLYVDYRIYHSLKRIQKLLPLVVVPFALIVVLVVCDLFGAGLLFSITEQNVYQRCNLGILPYVFLLYDYSLSLILAFLAVKRNNHVYFFPVLSFVVPVLIGTMVQAMRYGLSAGWFSVSLALMFVQMQLNNQNAFVDDLSGLYNRKYYQYVISKLTCSKKSKLVIGIMMDVNHFKSINDQFGHTIGDDAIRELGRLISEITTERDMAFRYAGDEFIIISTADQTQDAEQLVDALLQKTAEFNAASRKPYQLSLAIGYTLSKTAELDFDKFLHQMDMQMYEAKTAYYSREGKDRRNGSQ